MTTEPVPRFKLLVPTNEKSPFQFWRLFCELTRFATELSIEPPLMVNVPAPSAIPFPKVKVPALRVVPPEWVLLPPRISVPEPFLIRLKLPPPPLSAR